MLGELPSWAAPKKRAFYVLEPEYGRGAACNVRHRDKPDGCHGCKACHRHGNNKMFATRGAADKGRAHPGCKCKVVVGGRLDKKTWNDLFGTKKVADRRSDSTKAAFKRRRRRRRRARRRRGKD